MFLAKDLLDFKQKFSNKLQEMLASDSLGAFILVLANSMQDEELYGLLKQPVNQRFDRLVNNTPDAPIDDLQVFERIKKSGIASLTCWESYQKDLWGIVYNPLRAMRPARSSDATIELIQQPFNPNAFHFNKPFLKPEILWEGDWSGKNHRVLYNKFPFAPWHLLIVPEPEKEQPQYLTQIAHQDIFTLSTESNHLSGFGIGFNSLGAYASINQLHFQGFMDNNPLPVEAPEWKHNGGKLAYPLACQRYDNHQEAWSAINQLHHENQPYNLLYRRGYCYVIPRKGQGTVELPEWTTGVGWYEICGRFTLLDRDFIATLSADIIHETLNNLN